MKLAFPDNFLWGTSTSALQIETAFDHDWKGLKARDGSILEKTIEHEKHRIEDASIISSLGNAYRFSMDWSRLQRGPKAELEAKVVDEYRNFIGYLKDKNMHIMLVLHHFANPMWFVNVGSWMSKDSIELFNDYVKKVVHCFGDLVDSWNTFNEPNVYSCLGYLFGKFPPGLKNPALAYRVLDNMSKTHDIIYKTIKEKFPHQIVGVSNNTMVFCAESLLGIIPAKMVDFTHLNYMPDKFRQVDFVGISYYGRVPFRPCPITETDAPGELDKLGREHDKMWEYYPEGLKEILLRFHKRYEKPIILTENGCCTDDDNQRIKSISEHIKFAYESIQQGVDLRGYFYWSTFDNFELFLGNSYRFGLVSVDLNTMERKPKKSAEFYRQIARGNFLKM